MDAYDIGRQANSRIGETTKGYQNTLDEIRADTGLSDSERADLAFDAHDRLAPQYAAAVAERNAAFAERESEIRTEPFGAPSASSTGAAFTGALLRANDADEKGLETLASLAASTGDKTLGRAVLAVATQRDALASALPFVNSDAETLGLFREWQTIPDAEARQKSEESGLPQPQVDTLRPSARAALDAEHSRNAERVRRAMRR